MSRPHHTIDNCQLIAWTEAFHACGPTQWGRFLTKVSAMVRWVRHQTLSGVERQERRWMRRNRLVVGREWGWWGVGGCSEEKLICLQLLSLIAWACLTGSITVNHCGSTRLLRHTIPPCAPRQIISFTSSAWWESLKNVPYNNLPRDTLPKSCRCHRICFARRVLLIGWEDSYLMGTLSSATLCGYYWALLIMSDIRCSWFLDSV